MFCRFPTVVGMFRVQALLMGNSWNDSGKIVKFSKIVSILHFGIMLEKILLHFSVKVMPARTRSDSITLGYNSTW